MKKILFFILTVITLSVTLQANPLLETHTKVYEDGNSWDTKNWVIYDNNPLGSTIENINDTDRNSRVIKFQGDGLRNSYLIGGTRETHAKAWKKSDAEILRWSMKFNEKFKISIYINTKKGRRVIIYDYKNENEELYSNESKRFYNIKNKKFHNIKSEKIYNKRYIRIGLGEKSNSGEWIDVVRNIKADLSKYEPDNTLLAIQGMKVQGSGLIDDIIMFSLENQVSCPNSTIAFYIIPVGIDLPKMVIVDISDISNPIELGRIVINDTIINDLVVDSSCENVYLSTLLGLFIGIDISNPSHPFTIDTIHLPHASHQIILYENDSKAVVASNAHAGNAGSVAIVDISASNYVKMDSYLFLKLDGEIVDAQPKDMILNSNEQLLFVNLTAGLQILNLSNPQEIIDIGHYTYNNIDERINSITLSSDETKISGKTDSGELIIIDVSDPAHPVRIN